MKKHLTLAPVAALGLFLGSTALHAEVTTETLSVSAAVQGALSSPTGFLTGGQVQVTGVGQGSVVLTRDAAAVTLDAGATSNIVGSIPVSSSKMISTFDFTREIETGGALVGVGNVVAQGESLGGVGIVGSASANATRAGTGINALGENAAGSSTTPTSAQGSLVGDFNTTNTMQLTGNGSLFAGAQTLSIGERNAGISAGITGPVSGNTLTINLDGLTLSTLNVVPTATGTGGGFLATSALTGPGAGIIDMNASNAGNGTVLVSGSTGGFFGEGTAFGATAAPTFSQVNGFFSITSIVPNTLPPPSPLNGPNGEP